MVKKVRSEDVSDYHGYWLLSNGKIMDRSDNVEVKPFPSDWTVRLRLKEGTRGRILARRLIALAFVRREVDENFVIHRDGDRRNMCASNLRWVRSVRGMGERTEQIIALRKQGFKSREIAEKLGLTREFVTVRLTLHRRKLDIGDIGEMEGKHA